MCFNYLKTAYFVFFIIRIISQSYVKTQTYTVAVDNLKYCNVYGCHLRFTKYQLYKLEEKNAAVKLGDSTDYTQVFLKAFNL